MDGDRWHAPWRCVLSIGAMECAWLGVCMILSPWYAVAPGLFRPISPEYVIPVGAVCLIAGIVGFVRPNMLGGGALLLVCSVRISQAIATHNIYPIGVWVVLLVALALTAIRFRGDAGEIILGAHSVRGIMAHLDRSAVQQAEEHERQTREAERQTIEGERLKEEGETA